MAPPALFVCYKVVERVFVFGEQEQAEIGVGKDAALGELLLESAEFDFVAAIFDSPSQSPSRWARILIFDRCAWGNVPMVLPLSRT